MRIHILTILRLRGQAGAPEAALRIEIEMRNRIRVGEMEFSEALRSLEEKGVITREIDEITGDRIWKLTSTAK